MECGTAAPIRDCMDSSGNIGSQGVGGSSGGGISVDSGTRSIPAPRWLGKRVGRFKLLALLGQGAMGRVFRAEDTLMGRHVALKLLPKTYKKGGVSVGPEMLINEARAAAAIEHPNAVQIYEVNQAGDVCYVAMELLEGGSLRDLVRAAGRMDLTRACLLCAEAAEALAAAHAAGVVHRDVKPANLMLSRQGRCKVVDFGLARLEGGDWGSVSESVGTPQFIAPEILSGTPASAQSDIYSLGGTLWYLLTGKAPYQGKDAQELLRMHMNAPIPDIRSVRPEAPAGLADALKTALAKRPADRFATMEQLARVLRVHAIPIAGSADNLDIPVAMGVPPSPQQRPAGPPNGRPARPATPPDPSVEVIEYQAQEPAGPPISSGGIGWMAFAGAALVLIAVVVVICAILFHPAATVVVQPPAPASPPITPVPPPTVVEVPPRPSPPAHSAPVLRFNDFEQQCDIGDVPHRGFVDFDAAHHVYRVTASGKDIYGKADAFHFVWRKMSGDVTIKANISFASPGKEPSRKGVLMIRQNLDAGSPFVDAVVHGSGMIALQYRPKANELTQQTKANVTGMTVWLERHKDVFTLCGSKPGQKPITLASITLAMHDPVYVGVGAASHSDTNTETAVFSNLSLTNKAIVP
jgi:serine/threonine protein kinase/regulation of enolase protein 1 (concanavalin A-like superfamily)